MHSDRWRLIEQMWLSKSLNQEKKLSIEIGMMCKSNASHANRNRERCRSHRAPGQHSFPRREILYRTRSHEPFDGPELDAKGTIPSRRRRGEPRRHHLFGVARRAGL